MTSRKEPIEPSSERTDKCVHIDSGLGICECKLQMEKKFQEFKKLTGDVFKEELQDQLHEKSKKLKELSTKLIRENHELTNRNKELEISLAELNKHNNELKVRLNELCEQNNDLLTALKDMQRKVTLTENKPDEA